MRGLLAILISIFGVQASAMPVKTKLLRSRAVVQDRAGGLHVSLDLKAKTLSFARKDFESCSPLLTRTLKTMEYTCRLEIPSAAHTSILQSVDTPSHLNAMIGGKNREVSVTVSTDAKSVVLKTVFDSTAVDGEQLKFNEELSQVYAKMGQMAFTEALRTPLKIEVLEGP